MSSSRVNLVQSTPPWRLVAGGSILMPTAPASAPMPALMQPTLVAGQPPVGHSVRSGGLDAEPFDFVLLVGAEVALEPEPLRLVVGVAFPGQDVRAGAVEEPAIVG